MPDKSSKNQPWWHINHIFKRIDMFGKEVPAFNVGGDHTVNTVMGGALSNLIFALALIYSIVKLTQVVGRHNPVIN